MPNIKSAEKRVRKSRKQQERNKAARSRMRTAIKNLREAVDNGDADSARELLPKTTSIVDGTARKGVIHANAAARTNSRLAKAVNALEA